MKLPSGFAEREHTADWELEVWAPNFLELLEQAARGMYFISGMHLEKSFRQKREVYITGLDWESLLVKFLSELLIIGEQEHLGFDTYQFTWEGEQLQANLEGAPITSVDKEIKAVTYHNLSVQKTNEGLVVNIVFDV